MSNKKFFIICLVIFQGIVMLFACGECIRLSEILKNRDRQYAEQQSNLQSCLTLLYGNDSK